MSRVLMLAVAAAATIALTGGRAVTTSGKPDYSVPDRMVEELAGLLRKNEIDQLLDRIAESDNEQIKEALVQGRPMLKLTREGLAKRAGSLLDIELVRTDVIGKSVIKYTYMEKYEKYTAFYSFSYYYNGSTWAFHGFAALPKIDDQYRPLHQE